MSTTHSDPLDELMLRAGADIRSPLLRTIVDLYLQKPAHTVEEERHFTELAVRLLEQADAATRDGIARQLASYPSVPEAIRRRLADDLRVAPAPPPKSAELRMPAAEDVASRASASELANLFFDASGAERGLILANLAYTSGPVAAFTGDTREATRQFETAALAHNPDAFVRALERWLGIAPTLARRIVNDPRGEPIVVATKAIGMAPDAVQRILLFLNPAVGQSVSRVHELARMFDTMDIAAAQALVAIWRAADPRAPAKPARPDSTDRGPRETTARPGGAARRGPADAPARVGTGQ